MKSSEKLLRFMTCGSVDDGKSTLIGRLIYESGGIYKDQLISAQKDSKKSINDSTAIDYSLLLDGLSAEREQGITIDVAYRYFKTANRKFIVADTPGHFEYTRNMATAASKSEVAVLLMSAIDGLQHQTSRHAKIAEVFGIKHICLIINKMDLVNYDQNIFLQQENKFLNQIKKCQFESITVIPTSALNGDLLIEPSKNMEWYLGPTLLNYLESVTIISGTEDSFVLPIQYVNKKSNGVRHYLGTVAAGQIKIGQLVYNPLSKQKNFIKEIFIGDKATDQASCDQAVSVSFRDQIDISRGDVLVADINTVAISQKFEAQIIWMSSELASVRKNYTILLGAQISTVQITKFKNKIDLDNLNDIETEKIEMNDIVCVEIEISQPFVIQKFKTSKDLGSFLLVDKVNHQTLAAGVVRTVELINTQNIFQKNSIQKFERETANGHKARVIWFTGLSGAGKSTLANALDLSLHKKNFKTYVLDADQIRRGLNSDLGFSVSDRAENIRRIAEVAKLMMDVGLIVIVAAISPFSKERELAKKLIGAENFIEIYVSTSLSVCENRDTKGLYSKARSGLIHDFTGIDSPYEKPMQPNLEIDTEVLSVEAAIFDILDYMQS